MTSNPAADLDANLRGRQFELILKHDDLAGPKLEEIRRFLNRPPRFVHESRRPKQDYLLMIERAFRCLALKAAAPRCKTMTARDFLNGHEADVVSVMRVFRAGIAEANKKSHDAASRAQLLLLVAATSGRFGTRGWRRCRTCSRGGSSGGGRRAGGGNCCTCGGHSARNGGSTGGSRCCGGGSLLLFGVTRRGYDGYQRRVRPGQ